jgi:hypothetical protein
LEAARRAFSANHSGFLARHNAAALARRAASLHSGLQNALLWWSYALPQWRQHLTVLGFPFRAIGA